MHAWLLFASLAWAHRPGLSYAEIGRDELVLTFARSELAARVPMEEPAAARELLTALIVRRATVRVGDEPCALGEARLAVVKGGEPAQGNPGASDGVELRVPMDCTGAGQGSYEADFLQDLGAGHRHYVEAQGQPVAVLDATHDEAPWSGRADRGEVAGRFTALGVEHIWTGYDHLLFLVGLLLTAGSLRAMLLIVTGFTVAHSITLSLAALGHVTLPGALVEPAIAASIAWVGVENFWNPAAKRRVILTFFLGLLHGFGFAGMLAQLGLPSDALALALVCFNGGVELGQAAVVAVVLPLLLVLRRYPWWLHRAVPAGSAAVALAGGYWFVERVWG